jgi:phosphoglycolate phosphatase
MSFNILFDLDGTLTDPKPGITRCIQHALTALGYPVPLEDELLWCIGPPLRGSFSHLLDSTDNGLLDKALWLYRERFAEVGLFENALIPGVTEALDSLKNLDAKLFLATSIPSVYAARIIGHFGLDGYFDKLYGSELDGTLSDKAELIAHILAQESINPATAVMVGDREHDVVGAMRCGIKSIGVTYGYGTEAELLAHGASAIAHTPGGIAAVLAQWLDGQS